VTCETKWLRTIDVVVIVAVAVAVVMAAVAAAVAVAVGGSIRRNPPRRARVTRERSIAPLASRWLGRTA